MYNKNYSKNIISNSYETIVLNKVRDISKCKDHQRKHMKMNNFFKASDEVILIYKTLLQDLIYVNARFQVSYSVTPPCIYVSINIQIVPNYLHLNLYGL